MTGGSAEVREARKNAVWERRMVEWQVVVVIKGNEVKSLCIFVLVKLFLMFMDVFFVCVDFIVSCFSFV